MLLLYGDYTLSFSIASSAGNTGGAFLTDPAALANGRSGDGCLIRFPNTGPMTTATYVEITVGMVSPFGEATPRIGGCGVVNLQGLPVGTKVTIGGITQRLVNGPRLGELCAWALPFVNGNSLPVRVYNDVNGVPSIAAGTPFGLGGLIPGRVITLPTLITGAQMARTPTDTTGYQRSSGNQLHQFMRKPYWNLGQMLGRFTTKQAKGGTLSNLASGGNPAGTIDVQSLIMVLASSSVFAVCDTPSEGQGAGVVSNGVRYDQDFMQSNWLMVRPVDMSSLVMDKPPTWSWSPRWQEAS
jgi:hypothetical protein